jgi:hypothetical protein
VLKLADGVAQAVLQSTGEATPAKLLTPSRVAVIVIRVPKGIPVIVLPLTVPALVVTTDPGVTEKTTLYVPPPLHTPWPAAITGALLSGQVVGLPTIILVIRHPFVDVAVNNTPVPTGILITAFPLTVPAEAVTMPLELNDTL